VATIWADEAKRKTFMKKYANLNDFNYKVYDEWASQLAKLKFIPKVCFFNSLSFTVTLIIPVGNKANTKIPQQYFKAGNTRFI